MGEGWARLGSLSSAVYSSFTYTRRIERHICEGVFLWLALACVPLGLLVWDGIVCARCQKRGKDQDLDCSPSSHAMALSSGEDYWEAF